MLSPDVDGRTDAAFTLEKKTSHDAMLARANRLKNSREFRQVYEEGYRAQGRFVVLRFRRTPRRTTTRVGITVSTRVSKKASVRNRLKRQLRDAARRVLDVLPHHLDVVITARPEAVEKPFPIILNDFVSIAERIRRMIQTKTNTRKKTHESSD